MDKNKHFISWDDIETCIELIAEHYKDKGIKAVTGPPRGGLIPAVLLSHRMGIPYRHTVDLKKNDNTVLWVDDIIDSGDTLLSMSRTHNWNPTGLYVRDTAKMLPDYAAVHVFSEDWLVFPWEQKESDTIQDYLK